MSYMDKKNILSEGLIDKIISVITKKKKIKDLKRAEKKAYDDAMKHFKKAQSILAKTHKARGIKSKFTDL